MSKVIFRFDKEKDLRNNWHKSNWKEPFSSEFKIDPKIKEICSGKTFEECKEDLSDYLSKMQNSPYINLTVQSLEKAWRIIEKEFFGRMDRIMKNKFIGEIHAYLTTLGTCPYNPEDSSFMFSIHYALLKNLQTCGHEIMHLYFHRFYWDKIEEQVGKEKTADLKEALTVLLNFEFKDLWFVMDFGYESHNELRRFITEEWKEEKDFDLLLDKCVQFLKSKL